MSESIQEMLQSRIRLRFESLANASPALLWTSNPDKNSDWFNQRWLDFTGRTIEQEKGNGWITCLHPEDVDRCWSIYICSFDARQAFSMEHRLLRYDGEYRWLLAHGLPQYNDENVFIGYIVSCLDITEDKLIRDALNASEQRLRLALQAANQGMYDLNIQTGATIVSPEYALMLGHDPDTFQETLNSWLSRLHPDDRVVVENNFRQYIAGDLLDYRVEFRLRTLTGNWKWILSQGSVVEYTATGEPLRMLGTHTDIDTRKLAEETLREQEEFFRLIAENIADFIAVLDLQGKRIYNSPSYYRFFGVDRQLVGSDSFADIHPDDREHIKKIFKMTVETGKGQSTEYRMLLQDGSIRYMESQGCVIADAEGKPLRVVVISRDITERKQMETEAKRYEAIVHSSTDAIISKTLDGIITSWNPGAENLFGYSPEEMIGNQMQILFPPDRVNEESLIMERIAIGDRVEHFETIRVHKDGHQIHVSITTSPIYDELGKIIGASKLARNITERKQAEDKIYELAFFDPLTHLPNRRLLSQRLEHAIASCTRQHKYGALLFLDLDNFKILNDTQGHNMGDELLIQVARRLQECVRELDTVARLGGDEFVILLEDLDEFIDTAVFQAKGVVEKIGNLLSKPFHLSNSIHNTSCSIGVTMFINAGTQIDTVLLQADTAMYEAKKQGKNAYRFFDPEMQHSLTRRVELERALRNAVATGEFRLFYQPQVDVWGQITGVEALIRWQRSANEMVSPLEFIPLAEESGIIHEVGRWVIETACAQLKEWASHPKASILTMSVNVSAKQFYQPNFVQEISDIIQHYDIDSGKLKLELTEGMVLEDMNHAVKIMKQLQALGIALSMDDFGVGYSSLSYLRKLPFDQVKIDKSFLDGINYSTADAYIVQTVICIGKLMGMGVIAEGVEDAQKFDILKDHGCPGFQGYYFGRPLPLEEFEQLLNNSG